MTKKTVPQQRKPLKSRRQDCPFCDGAGHCNKQDWDLIIDLINRVRRAEVTEKLFQAIAKKANDRVDAYDAEAANNKQVPS
jgi:hypothetical protein